MTVAYIDKSFRFMPEKRNREGRDVIFSDSLSWKPFKVLHLVVQMKNKRTSCVKNDKRGLEREVQTAYFLTSTQLANHCVKWV